MANPLPKPKGDDVTRRSDAWTDLALTLPIFVIYHLGVVFLSIRNAADPVTKELQTLANHSLPMYAVLTLAIGVAFVAVLSSIGRKNPLKATRFGLMAGEGALYAVMMRFAGSYVVGSLRLAGGGSPMAPSRTWSWHSALDFTRKSRFESACSGSALGF